MPSDGRPNTPGAGEAQYGVEFRQHRQGVAALALRLAGASYAEIAEALTMASSTIAREAVESSLAAQTIDNPDVALLREEEGARLLRLLRGVWAKATDPEHPDQLTAVRIATTLVDRRIRLFGLDMPQKVEIYSPAEEEINNWIGDITHERVGMYAAIEASVVSAE